MPKPMKKREHPSARTLTIVGIDPGKKGGIALFDQHGEPLSAIKMPATERDLANELRSINAKRLVGYIELVGSMPRDGHMGAFKFGYGFGTLIMGLTMLDIPIHKITPATWMKHYGMRKRKNESKTQWKNRLKQRAQELFPSMNPTLSTCDALLIGKYGVDMETR